VADKNKITVELRLRDLATKELKEFEQNATRSGRRGKEAFSKVDTAAGKLAKRLGAVAVAFVGIQSAIRGIRAAVTAGFGFVELAGDVEESRSKFEELFSGQLPEANAQLELLATNLGRSQSTLQNAASDLQALILPLGFSAEEAAGLSFEITRLSQDVESFRNVKFEDVLRDIRSGLVGQSEPLLKYGADIREAAVQQKALELGLADTAKELTQQDKIVARLSIIYAAFDKDLGDVQRTSDSYANSLRALRESTKDVRIELGQNLIKEIKGAIVELGGAAEVTNDYRFVATAASFVTAGFIRAVVSLIKAGRQLADSFGGSDGTVGSLKRVGTAVAVLSGAFQVLVETIVFLGRTAKNNFEIIARLASKNFRTIAVGLDVLINAFNTLAGSTEVSNLAANFKETGSVLEIVADGVKANAEAVKDFGIGIARAGIETAKLKEGFDNISTAFGKLIKDSNLDRLIPGLPEFGGALDAALNRAVSQAKKSLTALDKSIEETAGAFAKATEFAGAFIDKITSVVAQEIKFASATAGAKDAFTAFGESLSEFNLARGATQAVFQTITRGLADVTDALIAGESSFSEFARGVARSIGSIIAQFYILRALRDGLGFSAGGLFSGFGFGDSITGLANGGVMQGQMSNSLPINGYANGGIANSPQMAIFGEGRGAEAFVPLPDGKNIPVKMEGGGQGVTVNITVPSLDPKTAAEVIQANLPTITSGVANAILSGQDRKLVQAVGRG